MFAPVIRVDGEIVFVNPTLIQIMAPAEPLEQLGPDGNPWPTTIIYFGKDESLQAKGSPQMILTQWFGQPENSRIVVPRART